MLNLTKVKPLESNKDDYDRLMAVIEASQGMLALLIVSCEQRAFREEIIERYETELSPEISCYRVQLDPQEPSLRAALEDLVEQNAGLDQAQTVVTVMGISELIDICLKETEEKSPLEQFFGYLQWTREGLRAFPFPIILWVTPGILKQMSLAAPDFWSWRTGVFRFVAMEMVEVAALDWQPIVENREDDINQILPITELEKQVSQIQSQNVNSPALATLYDRLGQAYSEQIWSGKSKNLQVDIDQAIASFQQAMALQKKLDLKSDLGNSLTRFGDLYYKLNQYQQAEALYQQAFEITEEIGDRQGMAISLGSLGNCYESLGQYKKAIAHHQQSLDISEEIGYRQGVAISLGNLGICYHALGQYEKAIVYHQQSLEIKEEIGYRKGVANSLGNLGTCYDALGQHEQAITLYQQCHNISEEMGYRQGVAFSLHNIGDTLIKLEQYSEAETKIQASLIISQAINFKPLIAHSLKALADIAHQTHQPQLALSHCQQALALSQELGIPFLKDCEKLLAKIQENLGE